jgi:hypothetical protein
MRQSASLLMGRFINPKSTKFPLLMNGIYIDKTEVISLFNSAIDTESRFICDSRPRRFGKTTTADMLVEYYKSGHNT